jgi:phage terminase large subunit-like protein
MTVLTVPELDAEPYPTLGPQVWEWMLESLVYGPGDLRGVPLADHPPSEEFMAIVHRIYETFPADHPQAGRRRFRRVGLSHRKGIGKTEMLAWFAAAELHPEAPVRCDGFDAHGEPVGRAVNDPYIPLVATSEQQSDELAYEALRVILSEGPLADDLDIGLDRITRRGGDGRAVSLATAPNARDGARTTFQGFDETHRWILPRMHEAHRTMMANLVKRKLADPWSLEITTAPAPGEGSVAEGTMDYAKAVAAGKITDSRLFYFHRQASDDHDLTTEPGVRAAVIEASGPAAEWSDIDGIVDLWRDPQTDPAYFERVYCNRLVQQTMQAFDAQRFADLADPDRGHPADGSVIGVGFDGSRFEDSTVLVGVTIEGEVAHLFLLGAWEKPSRAGDEWEVPEEEVEAVLEATFERYEVALFFADPHWWDGHLATWQRRWGKRVQEWRTNRPRVMGEAVRAFGNAIRAGELTHDGDPRLASHIGNARRRDIPQRTEDGQSLFYITKERSDSPHKIDAAMAAILAMEARNDARASGAGKPEPEHYFQNVKVRETPGSFETIEVAGLTVRDDPKYHDEPPRKLAERADINRRFSR